MTIYSTPRKVPVKNKRKEEVSVSKARLLNREGKKKFHLPNQSAHTPNWKFKYEQRKAS